VTEYDSNKDSDVESLTKSKECINMLLNTKNNLYDWYIDSEVSTYIINCQDLFTIISFYHKNFEAVNEKMITATECNDVIIYTKIRNLLLKDVVLISKCTSNLISLRQLWCSDIIYQDENSRMTLTRDEHTIVSAQQVENLFIFNIVRKNIIMIVQNALEQAEQLKYLCSLIKKLQLWHHWLVYMSVVWIKHTNQIITELDLLFTTESDNDVNNITSDDNNSRSSQNDKTDRQENQ